MRRLVMTALLVPFLGCSGGSGGAFQPRAGAQLLWEGRDINFSGTPVGLWNYDILEVPDLVVDGDDVYVIVRTRTPAAQIDHPDPNGGPTAQSTVSGDLSDNLVASWDHGKTFAQTPLPNDPAVSFFVWGIEAYHGTVALVTVGPWGSTQHFFIREIDPKAGVVVPVEALANEAFIAFFRGMGDLVGGTLDSNWESYRLSTHSVVRAGVPGSECGVPWMPVSATGDELASFGYYTPPTVDGISASQELCELHIPPSCDCMDLGLIPHGAGFNPAAFQGSKNTWLIISDQKNSWALRIEPGTAQPVMVPLGAGYALFTYEFHQSFGPLIPVTEFLADGSTVKHLVDIDGTDGPEELIFPDSPYTGEGAPPPEIVRAAPLGDDEWLVVYRTDESTVADGLGRHPFLYALRAHPTRKPVVDTPPSDTPSGCSPADPNECPLPAWPTAVPGGPLEQACGAASGCLHASFRACVEKFLGTVPAPRVTLDALLALDPSDCAGYARLWPEGALTGLEQATCTPGCLGDALITECSGPWVNAVTDCAADGRVCTAGKCLPPGADPAADPATWGPSPDCPLYCPDGFDCHNSGSNFWCATLESCESDHCEGDTVVHCSLDHASSVRTDCALLGQTCALEPYFGPYCSAGGQTLDACPDHGLTRFLCQNDLLTYCANKGDMHYVDCKALGFTGCEDSQTPGYYRGGIRCH